MTECWFVVQSGASVAMSACSNFKEKRTIDSGIQNTLLQKIFKKKKIYMQINKQPKFVLCLLTTQTIYAPLLNSFRVFNIRGKVTEINYGLWMLSKSIAILY